MILELSTGLSTGLAAGIAIWAAIVARRAGSRAESEARRLSVMRGRVLTMEAELEALTSQHRSLRGKFYASRGQKEETPHEDPATLENWEVCDNFQLAQRDGPRSPASACECAYCTDQRARRAAARAAFVPKGQPARLEAIKRGQES